MNVKKVRMSKIQENDENFDIDGIVKDLQEGYHDGMDNSDIKDSHKILKCGSWNEDFDEGLDFDSTENESQFIKFNSESQHFEVFPIKRLDRMTE